MRFSWDPDKSSANYRDRGFDFTVAAMIFDGPTLEREDSRRDYGERRMNAKRYKKPSRVAERPRHGQADFERIRRTSEQDIMRTSPEELGDLPPDFWDEAELVIPVPKRAISLRVDEDVLEWFRGLGPRYQTRMNAVLRSYMKRAAPQAKPTRPRFR